jgi:hypothetical protein
VISNSTEERERRDFRNYFKLTFFESAEAVASSGAIVTQTGEAPNAKMQLFKQRELIEGDFAIVSGALPIAMKNVKAEIVDGNYLISIFDVVTTVPTKMQSYVITVSSDYVFQTEIHAFRNVAFTVKNSNGVNLYGGIEVKLLPVQINTIDFENQFRKIGGLLDIAVKHYVLGDTEIRFDLDANSVII